MSQGNTERRFPQCYNRQYTGEGTATAFQTRGFDVSGTIAISGEELPRDNGLFTRCVILQMSAYKRSRERMIGSPKQSYIFGLTYYTIMEWFYDEHRVKEVIRNIET